MCRFLGVEARQGHNERSGSVADVLDRFEHAGVCFDGGSSLRLTVPSTTVRSSGPWNVVVATT